MRLRKIPYYLTIILFITAQLYAQNTNPVVTNVAISLSGITVTVTYDVADTEQSAVTIRMQASSNNGVSWAFNYGSASGDIGTGVTTGTGKIITWTYAGTANPLFKIRIFANDETADGSPCSGTETVIYEGKTYNTIQIGDQCWLKENLDVGTRINGVIETSNNGVIEKYCYNNDPANCTTYGGLYVWNEAMQYSSTPGTQGICRPTGWHLPTLTEFETLKTAVNNDSNSLKAIGQGTGGGVGTNTSGFSVLVAGSRSGSGNFLSLGLTNRFWSSHPDALYLRDNDSEIIVGGGATFTGFSVRCVKD